MNHSTHCEATQRTSGKAANTRSAFTPARGVLLQRKCACGGSADSSGECEECRTRKVQRKVSNSDSSPQSSEVPSIVSEVLQTPGQPLDVPTREFIEPRLAGNFSRADAQAE